VLQRGPDPLACAGDDIGRESFDDLRYHEAIPLIDVPELQAIATYCEAQAITMIRMRLGIIADIHGNDVAVRAVLRDADRFAVDCWWALSNLVVEAAASLDLVERYAAMSAGIGWTRGVLDQAGLLTDLTTLPTQLRVQLPSRASPLICGV
jgi:hypothetical protein